MRTAPVEEGADASGSGVVGYPEARGGDPLEVAPRTASSVRWLGQSRSTLEGTRVPEAEVAPLRRDDDAISVSTRGQMELPTTYSVPMCEGCLVPAILRQSGVTCAKFPSGICRRTRPVVANPGFDLGTPNKVFVILEVGRDFS